jgi:DNA repair protein RAD57
MMVSASGKTQLALQLSLFVQIVPDTGGLGGSCCYLTTSSNLPTERLLQISQNHKALSASSCSLDHVHTIAVPSIPILLHVLSRTLKDFIQDSQTAGVKPVKLVVIDTLAELFHDAQKTTTATLVERSQRIAEIGLILHTLAAEYQIAIVVLNEVVDVFNKDRYYSDDKMNLSYSEQSRWFARGDSVPGEDGKEASLGLTWANQVNTRILLSRTGRRRYLSEPEMNRAKIQKSEVASEQTSNIPAGFQAQDDDQSTLIRRFNVIFSSVSPSVSLDYIVTESGVSALRGTTIYPSAASEFATVKVSVPLVGQRWDEGDTTQGAPLDTGVVQDRGAGFEELAQDSAMIPDGEFPQDLEDEWDQYWENDEISSEAYLSIQDSR